MIFIFIIKKKPIVVLCMVHHTTFMLHMFILQGVVYIMDHEIAPRSCTIWDWLLNSSWDHFGLHQGKNDRVTMKFEVPKRHI